MNLDQKDINIINVLLHSTGYTSAKSLAASLRISQRHVREQIAQLKPLLEKEGYELISQRSKGYTIRPLYPNTLEKLEEEISEIKGNQYQNYNHVDRPHEIAQRLVYAGDYIKAEKIIDEMMVSRSTFSNDLKEAKEFIKRYRLVITHRPNYGLRIEGTEYGKRKLLADRIFSAGMDSEMIYTLIGHMETPNQDEGRILDVMHEYQVAMSDLSCFDFLLYLSIALNRQVQGYELEGNIDADVEIPQRYIDAGNRIYEVLLENYPIKDNPYERRQIILELVSKSHIRKEDGSAFAFKDDLVDDYLDDLKDCFCIDYRQYPEVHEELLELLESFLYHIVLFTKKRTCFCYEYGTTLFTEKYYADRLRHLLKTKFGHSIGEGDTYRTASYFHNLYYEKKRIQNRILLVGSLDKMNEELLCYYIKNKHPYYVKSIKSVPLYRLNEIDPNSYDVIISVIPIPEELEKPFICVTPVLTPTDHAKLEYFFKIRSYRQKIEFSMDPRLYAVLNHSNKDVIPDTVCDLLLKCGVHVYSNDRERMYKAYEQTYFDYRNGLSVFRFHLDIFPADFVIVIVLSDQIVLAVSHRHEGASIFRAVCDICEEAAHDDVKEVLKNPSYKNILALLKDMD